MYRRDIIIGCTLSILKYIVLSQKNNAVGKVVAFCTTGFYVQLSCVQYVAPHMLPLAPPGVIPGADPGVNAEHRWI